MGTWGVEFGGCHIAFWDFGHVNPVTTPKLKVKEGSTVMGL